MCKRNLMDLEVLGAVVLGSLMAVAIKEPPSTLKHLAECAPELP